MRVLLLSALFGLTFGENFARQLISRNFPHLIIPLNSFTPDTAYNTQQTAQVSKGNWSAVSWDVPLNDALECELGFNLNLDKDKNAPWNLWGVNAQQNEPFLINIAELPLDAIKVGDGTTWNKQPKTLGNVATVSVYPNGTTAVKVERPILCQKKQVAQFLLQPADENKQPFAGLTWWELDYTPPHGITYDMYKPVAISRM